GDKVLSCKAIVHLNKIHVQSRQPIHGLQTFFGRVDDPSPIISFLGRAFEHWTGEYKARSQQFSRINAAFYVGELRYLSSHIADSRNPVRKKQMQYAVLTVGMDMHVPKAGKEKLAAPINHPEFLR